MFWHWIKEPFQIIKNQDSYFIQNLIMLVFTILGLAYNPIFYSLLLFYFIMTQPTLSKVIDAVYLPRWSIFWTFILLIALLYLASIFYYINFKKDFNTISCNSLAVCILAFIDSTWKGNTWNIVQFDYSADAQFRYSRFLSDAIFLVIIVQIVSQMFTGIIVD